MKNHPAFFPLLSALALSGAMASAQTRPVGNPAPTSAAPPSVASSTASPSLLSELKITLMDGSIVAGKLSISDVAIDTKFGSLKVPVDQIQSLVPGLLTHPQFSGTLDSYINDLASDSFADREKAQAALTKIGPELKSQLEREVKTAQNEKQMRLQKVIDDFESQLADDDSGKIRQWVPDDVIVTPGFTVVGHITTPGFSVTSPYGTLQLKFNDIREARRDDQQPEDINKNITVAGTSISQRTAVSSTIRLNKGDQVTISAAGSITLTPWGGQATGPDGNTDIGNSSTGGFPIGTLYARIGDNGPYIKVGSKTSFTAAATGVLNLGIATPNGNYSSYQFPGEFQTKIHVVKKN